MNYHLHKGLMLPISKVFTFLSTLPVWDREYLSKYVSTKLFFQMRAQVYSVTCGELLLKCFIFLLVGIGNILAIFKIY